MYARSVMQGHDFLGWTNETLNAGPSRLTQ